MSGFDFDPPQAPSAHPDLTRAAAPGVLSVGRLLASVRLLVERRIGLVWVAGEVSGCLRAASGHCYFTLKDEQAQVRCILFRSKAQALGFDLRDGVAVEVRATPTIYDARGDLQLNVDTVRLAGLGALFERFVRMKARLEAAGWFAPGRKRPLPAFSRCVGVITSRRAAALRDVLATLARWPALRVVLYPAAVQGSGATDELAAAVRAANAHGLADVLIVCRGGGSLEDLWAFNEEPLARAIVESRLPVVSGVGHESDFTICDFVADVRAPTPTAAAALVAPDRAALAHRTGQLAQRFVRVARHALDVRTQRLDHAARRLVHPAARLARRADDARALAQRLARAQCLVLDRYHARIVAVQQRFLRELRLARPSARAVAQTGATLKRCGRAHLARLDTRVAALATNLAHLDPRRVLDRGYAIVAGPGGAIVQDAREVPPGSPVAITFARGRAAGTITHVDDN